MNTKLLLAGVAAGIVGFLLGWLLFGILLMGYFEANIIQYNGLMRSEEEMNLLGMALSNILYGVLLAWICLRTAATSVEGGLRTGALVGLLLYASMALFYMSMMNWYANIPVMLVEILANTIWSACMGAVAGAVLVAGSRVPKAAV
jgi:hypothetical protein